MGDNTGIQWTQATWNPLAGCRIESPGCANCYAMREAHRLGANPKLSAKYGGLIQVVNGRAVWTGEIRPDAPSLDQPLRWRRPRLVFVNSMSDLFADGVPDGEIDKIFAVMALSPHHVFQVLTKRARRMRDYLTDAATPGRIADRALSVGRNLPDGHPGWRYGNWTRRGGAVTPHWPLPNVWLGVSVERQKEADFRIPDLLTTPAVLRFVSCEPLLGPVKLDRIRYYGAETVIDALAGRLWTSENDQDGHAIERLDWAIVGGESGPHARDCHAEWISDLVVQGRDAGTPVFVKQLGAAYVDAVNGVGGAAIRVPSEVPTLTRQLRHKKGGDPSEWPEHLRVQQMPRVAP